MKKIVIIYLGFQMLTTPVLALDNPGQKLERGVVNIVTSPVEIPKEIRRYWIMGSEKTYHIIVWVFAGTIKGFISTLERAGSGVWDVVSFPVKVPANYEPLLRPDYVFEDWPKRKIGVVYKNLGDQ